MFEPYPRLPTAEELPDSDDTPVDNELQDLLPGLLRLLLTMIWAERQDWFWGTDMAFYFDPDDEPIVPDGFLALGVPRFTDENLRRSYVLWQEKVVPILTLEVVSRKRRREYSQKKRDYADLGVQYYVIYNAMRTAKETLEVYRLEDGEYVLMAGNPILLPELGLGIGRERGTYQGIEREWLYWYDQSGKRYPTPEERIFTVETEVERLRQRLRDLGLDPNA
jgi:Uma2 family endonuclease